MNVNSDLATVISPCCKAFNHYINSDLVCSKCNKILTTVNKNEEIVIAVHYNTRNMGNNDDQTFRINRDIVDEQTQKYKRMANDPTLELVNIHCPVCGEQYGRFFRNAHNVGMCVCKNRHLY